MYGAAYIVRVLEWNNYESHIVDDRDICTVAAPSTVMSLMTNNGVEIVRVDFQNGLVTAVIGSETYKIATKKEVSND